MVQIIEIETRKIEELRTAYPNLYATYKHHLPSLTDEEIALAMSIATDICWSCRDSERGCQCWNDE